MALHIKNQDQELLDGFVARSQLLVGERKPTEALQLLMQANEIDPGEAWLRTLRVRTMLAKSMQRTRGLEEAALAALEEMPLPPAPRKEARLEPLAPVSEGRVDVFYLQASNKNSGYDSLFEEYSALTGRPRVQRVRADVLSRMTADQWLAVSPSYVEKVSKHLGKTLYLGPHRTAEQVLDLVGAKGPGVPDDSDVTGGGCDFVSKTAALHTTPASPLVAPLPVLFRPFEMPKESTTLATIRCGEQEYPALVRSRDGRTMMFTFDFPAWIIRLRQGDITLANRETDDILGIRASDMFRRTRSSAELQVPHTDLVIEGIWRILEGEKPAPRLWHHPPGTKSTLIVTSDQDEASHQQMEIMLRALQLHDVQPTFLLMPKEGTFGKEISPPDAAFVKEARAFGVEFATHPDFRSVPVELRGYVIAEDRKVFAEAFGFEPATVRNHWVAWWGWVAAAKRLQEAGYRYDLSYLTLVSKYRGGPGYMTGSGLPLRFYDRDGAPVEIRQLATQLDDHPNPVVPQHTLGGDVQLDRADFYAMTGALMARSANQFHSPLVVNNHPLQFSRDPDWLLTMVKAARSSDIAVMNVAEYARFVDGLLASSVRRLEGDKFDLLVQHPEQEVLLPGSVASAVVDGTAAKLQTVQRYDRTMRSLRLSRGRHTLELSL
jgi:PAS domain-containing protein